MSERLTSRLLVSALVRRAQACGGVATVLRKGDPTSGGIVVQLVERGRDRGFIERVSSLSGEPVLARCGPRETGQLTENSQYIERRGRSDPDIWFVELDVAEGEQLAAEVLCAG